MSRILWTDAEWTSLEKTLAKCRSGSEAVRLHAQEWKTGRNVHAIHLKLERMGKKLGDYLLRTPPPARRAEDTPLDKLVDLLLKECKKPEVSMTRLCDRLDMAPRRLLELVEYARSKGKAIEVGDQVVRVNRSAPPPYRYTIHRLPIEPVKDTIVFGAISDNHAGSLHSRPECLKDALEYAYYEHGVRRVFHSGDITDGTEVYGGQTAELSHPTIDGQIRAAMQDIPKMDGLEYDCIGGNHDEDHLKVGTCDAIARIPKDRPDIRVHGYYQALLDIGPEKRPDALKVELFHPAGGIPYARSYRLQKAIEKIPGGMKPHIFLCGHLHTELTMFYRGVFGVQVPSFQDQSMLGLRLGGAPEIGMFIFKVGITRSCSIKTISAERVMYWHSARGPVKCAVKGRDGSMSEKRFERRVDLN